MASFAECQQKILHENIQIKEKIHFKATGTTIATIRISFGLFRNTKILCTPLFYFAWKSKKSH